MPFPCNIHCRGPCRDEYEKYNTTYSRFCEIQSRLRSEEIADTPFEPGRKADPGPYPICQNSTVGPSVSPCRNELVLDQY